MFWKKKVRYVSMKTFWNREDFIERFQFQQDTRKSNLGSLANE